MVPITGVHDGWSKQGWVGVRTESVFGKVSVRNMPVGIATRWERDFCSEQHAVLVSPG